MKLNISDENNFIPTYTLKYIKELAERSTNSIIDQITRTYCKEVEQAIKQGLTAKELGSHLYDKFNTIKSSATGNSVARTMLHNVYNKSIVADSYYDEMIVGYKLIAILDDRTTPLCRRLNGKYIRKEDVYLYMPPFHYNCRTTIVPIYSFQSRKGFIDMSRNKNKTWYNNNVKNDIQPDFKLKSIRDIGITLNTKPQEFDIDKIDNFLQEFATSLKKNNETIYKEELSKTILYKETKTRNKTKVKDSTIEDIHDNLNYSNKIKIEIQDLFQDRINEKLSETYTDDELKKYTNYYKSVSKDFIKNNTDLFTESYINKMTKDLSNTETLLKNNIEKNTIKTELNDIQLKEYNKYKKNANKILSDIDNLSVKQIPNDTYLGELLSSKINTETLDKITNENTKQEVFKTGLALNMEKYLSDYLKNTDNKSKGILLRMPELLKSLKVEFNMNKGVKEVLKDVVNYIANNDKIEFTDKREYTLTEKLKDILRKLFGKDHVAD